MKTWTYTLDQIPQVAASVKAAIHQNDTILVYGEMGAGKTTLINEVLTQLGVNELQGSPTFPIVNEYLVNGTKVFHFDLYRLKELIEVYDLGMEDYLDQSAIRFIEWPQIALPLLEDCKTLRISENDDGSRTVTLE